MRAVQPLRRLLPEARSRRAPQVRQRTVGPRQAGPRRPRPAHDTLDRTILLLEDGKVYTRSTAALRALRHLTGPARGLFPLILLPKILRDPIYDIVARNRIRWFGRLDSCLVPSPQTRDRFIDL